MKLDVTCGIMRRAKIAPHLPHSASDMDRRAAELALDDGFTAEPQSVPAPGADQTGERKKSIVGGQQRRAEAEAEAGGQTGGARDSGRIRRRAQGASTSRPSSDHGHFARRAWLAARHAAVRSRRSAVQCRARCQCQCQCQCGRLPVHDPSLCC